ncbi:unnamed protein product [Rangifer tarandus platyrhynchus]|uniref:Uncharacterized protein n=2 Tax=Rangifer tarandus platyrhynchus TaxID=3082113 RepID=A0ACB0FK68_RANTA|nr:unnamed protein product [Rangifer tarandus platyrhynchus]CAI9713470.1 unnamed protein product [Rangifer tarandus platyrhynchus]
MRQDGAADEITLLSHPLRKKLKLEGGGENSHPYFLPTFPRKDRGCSGLGEGAGRDGPIAVNRPGPAGEAGSALPAPPGPTVVASARALGVGVGRGFPAGESSPGAGGGGEGTGSGNGGLRRTRARHERGRREGSWVKSGRAAPGERGEEPGSEVRALEPRLQSPPRERSEQEEPFCFLPRQHAPLLTELLFPGRWREELHPESPNPTPPPPSTANTLPNSTLPLYSLPSPPYRPCNNAVNLL